MNITSDSGGVTFYSNYGQPGSNLKQCDVIADVAPFTYYEDGQSKRENHITLSSRNVGASFQSVVTFDAVDLRHVKQRVLLKNADVCQMRILSKVSNFRAQAVLSKR